LRPWVALAQALHAGGLLELNPLGHFTVTDRAEPYLDHRLGNVAAIARVAEIVLAHTDAALTHARSHQGHADPRLLADELAADLVAAGYEPEPYEVFQVPKDSGGTRTLERLAPRDLVAQQYVNNLLAPVFDRAFSPASMAYRRGVSRESAAAKVRELIAEGNRFAVRTDVEAFFPSIDHARLMAELDRLLPMGDVQLRRMLQRVVVAPYRRDGAVQVRARGLAQGSPLSPLLANVLLDVLDRHMADAHIGFVRYADDMVLLARSRETAELALESARDALDEMGLCLSAEKTTPVLPVEQGFDFLGEHFDASTMDVHVNVLLPQRRPLLVTEPYLTLAVNGDAVDLRRDRALVATIPFRMVSEIVVVTKANFSTALIEKCAYHGIPLCVGLHTGTRSATMAPDTRACRETGWLQGQRYHALSERERTAVAADFAVAKILNYLPLVRDRFRGGDAALLHELESDAHEACHARDNNAIRGHEGIAARRLFSFVNREISKPFRTGFRSRRRDTKGSDRLNSMLNFGYHLLMTRLSGLIRGCGLNPYWAYLHETTDNYETLVYDVMEPFRVHVDRLVLRLINRRQIGECDFSLSGNSMRMTHDAVKTFAQEFEKLMGEVHGNLTINDSLLLQVENLKDFAVEGRPLLVYRWKPAQTSADNHQ